VLPCDCALLLEERSAFEGSVVGLSGFGFVLEESGLGLSEVGWALDRSVLQSTEFGFEFDRSVIQFTGFRFESDRSVIRYARFGFVFDWCVAPSPSVDFVSARRRRKLEECGMRSRDSRSLLPF
jgi:hypothetical protein